MTSNSLESLLAWMQARPDNDPMLGWDAIVALERDRTNRLLIQEYINRFSNDAYLPAISAGVVDTDNQWMEYIRDFILDAPRLSFEYADLDRSKAQLSMVVVGGSQVSLKKNAYGWQAVKVSWIDPLQGPALHLDLHLDQVPGNIADDGRILLDLSKSDNFRLTFAQTAKEQRLGGGFFQTLFTQLPDEQRVYPLGKIEPGADRLMRPQSFALRTQASGAEARDSRSPDFGRGAILIFVRMNGSVNEGDYPGVDSGFKYLIPDDAGKDYSATVLFSRERVFNSMMASVIDDIGTRIGNHDFTYVYDDNGRLVSATATAGELVIPATVHNFLPVTLPDIGLVYPSVYNSEIVLPAVGLEALTVTATGDKVSLRWRSEGIAGVIFTAEPLSVHAARLKCSIDLVAEYELVEDARGDAVVQPSLFKLDITVVDDTAALPEIAAPASDADWLLLFVYIWVQLRAAYDSDIRNSVVSALKQEFKADTSISPFIKETIKLNFGQAIQGSTIRAPYDVGFFGQINPTLTSFAISPMQPLMKQGAAQQFTSEPKVTGLEWRVEHLIPGSGNTGSIDSNGLYRAPTAELIEGLFTRVRVTATLSGGGYSSSALVTVVVNELTVNPLIQVCDIGERVQLLAGSLDAADVEWSIKNPVEGESGTVVADDTPEGDHIYIHGPVVADKTWVIDEIEVKNDTGQSRSVHVLALQKPPGLTLNRVESASLPQGQVQLEAILNSHSSPAEWQLPLGGPGTITPEGLYRADPATKERFVLVAATVVHPIYKNFEGYIILPLPLIEFPAVVQA
jgi:hypothetical protein